MEQKIYKYRPVPNWVPTPQWNFWKLLSNKKMVPENLLLCSAPSCQAHLFGGHTGWQILRTNAPYESVSFSGHQMPYLCRNKGISPSFSTQSSSAPTLTSSTASRLFIQTRLVSLKCVFFWCWKIFECYHIAVALNGFILSKKKKKRKKTQIALYISLRKDRWNPFKLPNQSTGELGSRPGSPDFSRTWLLDPFWPPGILQETACLVSA